MKHLNIFYPVWVYVENWHFKLYVIKEETSKVFVIDLWGSPSFSRNIPLTNKGICEWRRVIFSISHLTPKFCWYLKRLMFVERRLWILSCFKFGFIGFNEMQWMQIAAINLCSFETEMQYFSLNLTPVNKWHPLYCAHTSKCCGS